MTELRSIKIRGLWGWNEAVELETEPLESAGMKIQHELTYIAHGDISISYPNLIWDPVVLISNTGSHRSRMSKIVLNPIKHTQAGDKMRVFLQGHGLKEGLPATRIGKHEVPDIDCRITAAILMAILSTGILVTRYEKGKTAWILFEPLMSPKSTNWKESSRDTVPSVDICDKGMGEAPPPRARLSHPLGQIQAAI